MRFVKRIGLLLLLLPLLAQAALQFPALTGRVVDDAGLLSAQTRQTLTQLLAKHEQETGDQVVVVTLKSLQGTTIEDYGYQLGRYWGIGQKKKSNGVLLIVAPNEHKVRIEVGYGLEGVLTDALSNQIIRQVILPDFRAGKLDMGIRDGTKAILTVLGGGEDSDAMVPSAPSASTSTAVPSAHGERHHSGLNGIAWVFFIALGLGQFVSIFTRHRVVGGLAAGGLSFLLVWLFSALGTGIFIGLLVFFLHFVVSGRGGTYWGGGFGGGGFGGGFGGGGGFSGGGGSFGGGGSSGGW